MLLLDLKRVKRSAKGWMRITSPLVLYSTYVQSIRSKLCRVRGSLFNRIWLVLVHSILAYDLTLTLTLTLRYVRIAGLHFRENGSIEICI